jgi:hypothetical protein
MILLSVVVEVDIGRDKLHRQHIERIKPEVETMGKLLVQVRVTNADVQCIGYIRDILQLRDRRLVGPAIITETQVLAPGWRKVEIRRREEIGIGLTGQEGFVAVGPVAGVVQRGLLHPHSKLVIVFGILHPEVDTGPVRFKHIPEVIGLTQVHIIILYRSCR